MRIEAGKHLAATDVMVAATVPVTVAGPDLVGSSVEVAVIVAVPTATVKNWIDAVLPLPLIDEPEGILQVTY